MTPETPPDAPLTAEDMTPDPITSEVEIPPVTEAKRVYRFDKKDSRSFVLLQYDLDPETDQAIDSFIKHCLDCGWAVTSEF